MGNLLKETPHSEVTATLEVLAALRVERRHLAGIRKDPKRALVVAQAMIAGYVLRDPDAGNSLHDLIRAGNFGDVNPDITEANFPDQPTGQADFKVYDFKKAVSSDHVVAEMSRDGYHPANLRELLIWMIANWNGSDWVVALGQTWRDALRPRLAPYLYFDGKRKLYLRWYDDVWRSFYRFLAVRNSQPPPRRDGGRIL